MTLFSVIIADAPDQDALVAEIWLEGEQWGELSNDGHASSLVIYARDGGGQWKVDAADLVDAINRARAQLAP